MLFVLTLPQSQQHYRQGSQRTDIRAEGELSTLRTAILHTPQTDGSDVQPMHARHKIYSDVPSEAREV